MLVSTHKILGDERGQLVAIEGNTDVPFEIKRVFYIFGTQAGIPRGNHSHYKTRQYLIAVSGRCKVTLDDGFKKEVFDLDSPNKGLLQNQMVWGTMHDFSDDCVLLVIADQLYEAGDYIVNYEEFVSLVRS